MTDRDRSATQPQPRPASRAGRFRRAEDGSLIVFSLFIFVVMLMFCGLALDVMRTETIRRTLQNTIDRAAIASASTASEANTTEIVESYFEEAGLSDYLVGVRVVNVGGADRIVVDAKKTMNTHFFDLSGIEDLPVVAHGAATASGAGDAEVSMVLDVSGSMNSSNRLVDLKVAAKDFVDMLIQDSPAGRVMVSIVPYAAQVNAGKALLSKFNRGGSAHDYSHCVDFELTDFDTTAVDPDVEIAQAMHFDPYNDASPLSKVVCHTGSERSIATPFSTDPAHLKTRIDALFADGNTSIELGLKWGAALLDPVAQGVLSEMIDEGSVDAALAGRPKAFGEAAKSIVVLTDGTNTSHWYMDDPFRSGPSNVYYYSTSSGWDGANWGGETWGGYPSIDYYSIWGGDGEPVFPQDVSPTTCTDWDDGECERWEGPIESCTDWDDGECKSPIYVDTTCVDWDDGECKELRHDDQVCTDWDDGDCERWTIKEGDWYIPRTNDWSNEPYGSTAAYRLTWPDLWAGVSVDYHVNRHLSEMSPVLDDQISGIRTAEKQVVNSEKNNRTLAICDAAKAAGMRIYTIALDAPIESRNLLNSCATSDSHAFTVGNAELGSAFTSIANDVTMLRLVE